MLRARYAWLRAGWLAGFVLLPSLALALDLDYACFRGEEGVSYLEIYLSVDRSQLQYVPSGDSLLAEFKVVLQMFSRDVPVFSDTFFALDRVSKEAKPVSGQFFPHVFRMMMMPGRFDARVSLFQTDGAPSEVSRDSALAVRDFTGEELMISDIELGCQLAYQTDDSRFSKNGVRLIPNPSGFFGSQLPMFYYYAEVYNLDFDSASSDSYSVVRQVLTSDGTQSAKPESRRVYGTSSAAVVLGDGFPVATLRTGSYLLELDVASLRTGRSASCRKKFWIYRPDDFAQGRELPKDEGLWSRFGGACPSAIELLDPDSAIAQMRYLFTADQLRQVRRLTTEGRRNFIKDYWRDREQREPGASDKYFARVVESNRRYNHLNKAGWKTDRGRVFILYGEPDQIERNYGVSQMKDHEIWHFDRLEGGVLFVFMDRNGYGDLDLVHSTKRGELYNPNWAQSRPQPSRVGASDDWR